MNSLTIMSKIIFYNGKCIQFKHKNIAQHYSRIVVYWHDDVIKWKHFPRYWAFMWRINRSPVNSSRRPVTLNFDVSLICAWTNGWVNSRGAGDLRRNCTLNDGNVMKYYHLWFSWSYFNHHGNHGGNRMLFWDDDKLGRSLVWPSYKDSRRCFLGRLG